jgi:hypothetical protein
MPRASVARRIGSSGEPLIVEVHHGACECTASDCSAFAIACVIKQFAGADHKSAAELVIAANLTTTSKATCSIYLSVIQTFRPADQVSTSCVEAAFAR